MNRILLLAVGLILIGCNKERATGNLEEGSGTEISPQLKGVEDTAARLKVDTISSAKGAEEAHKSK